MSFLSTLQTKSNVFSGAPTLVYAQPNLSLDGTLTVKDLVASGTVTGNLSANNVVSGILNNARLPSAISVASITSNGALTGATVSGSGSALTALSATNVTSGTLNNARLPSAISVTSVAADGSALTALNATNVTTGTLNNARLPSAISVTSVAGDGSALTALNATAVTTGTPEQLSIALCDLCDVRGSLYAVPPKCINFHGKCQSGEQ